MIRALRRLWWRWRALGALPTYEESLEWTPQRWLLHCVARGWVDRLLLAEGKVARVPWWLFPLTDWDRDALVLVTSPKWWVTRAWRLVRPLFVLAHRIGAWDVEEGALWVTGRFNWRIWRAGRPWGA